MSLARRIPPADSHLWSLADQALVSGSNFLTSVVLARALGVEAFGIYVVAQMYLLYANTFQASLVVSSMMVSVPAQHDPAERQRMIQGFMGYSLLVLLVTVVGVQALAWLLGRASPHLGIEGLALPLGFAMAAFQLQDWLRRALYVGTRNRQVFVSDAIAYGGQFAVLIWLGWQQVLDERAALWVLAVAFALSALLTIPAARLRPDLAMTRRIIWQYARASGDYFASWQLQWLGSQGVILLGAGMVGPQAAGAIRAAQNLLGPVNVLFQWMDNVIPVRSALLLRDAGRGALVAYLGRIAWLGIFALTLFTLVLALFDAPLIVFLYGEEYRPFAILVVLQALYYLFGHGYRMVAYFHRALNNTRILAQSSFWWALAAVAFALLTVRWFADRGIMTALVVGEVAALAYLLWRRRAGTAGNEATRRAPYLMLRRNDGTSHLILSLRSRYILQSGLDMYYPSRWTGRLYRWSLAQTLPLRAQLGWIEKVYALEPWCPGLAQVLATLPGADATNIGVLIGASGPHSKHTLKLMDASGKALAYARLAHLPGAIAKLRNECAVLAALAAGPVAGSVPRLLASGELDGDGGFYLLESAGEEARVAHHPGKEHFEFLAALVGNAQLDWRTVLDVVDRETLSLRHEPQLETLIADILDILRAMPGPALVTCIEHGDFAPWNIRASRDNGLFVIDWEHARLDGLPWVDALHFVFQAEVLIRRRGPGQVLDSLLALFTLPAAQDYAQRMPPVSGYERALIAVYLLRVLALGASEGHAVDSPQQTARRLLLELLPKEIGSVAIREEAPQAMGYAK